MVKKSNYEIKKKVWYRVAKFTGFYILVMFVGALRFYSDKFLTGFVLPSIFSEAELLYVLRLLCINLARLSYRCQIT